MPTVEESMAAAFLQMERRRSIGDLKMSRDDCESVSARRRTSISKPVLEPTKDMIGQRRRHSTIALRSCDTATHKKVVRNDRFFSKLALETATNNILNLHHAFTSASKPAKEQQHLQNNVKMSRRRTSLCKPEEDLLKLVAESAPPPRMSSASDATDNFDDSVRSMTLEDEERLILNAASLFSSLDPPPHQQDDDILHFQDEPSALDVSRRKCIDIPIDEDEELDVSRHHQIQDDIDRSIHVLDESNHSQDSELTHEDDDDVDDEAFGIDDSRHTNIPILEDEELDVSKHQPFDISRNSMRGRQSSLGSIDDEYLKAVAAKFSSSSQRGNVNGSSLKSVEKSPPTSQRSSSTSIRMQRRQSAVKRNSLLFDVRRRSVTGRLSASEAQFLTSLITSPNITDEQIETTTKVLQNDPLFKVDDSNEEATEPLTSIPQKEQVVNEKEESDEAKALDASRKRKGSLDKRETQIQNNSSSYRKELWSESNRQASMKIIEESSEREDDEDNTNENDTLSVQFTKPSSSVICHSAVDEVLLTMFCQPSDSDGEDDNSMEQPKEAMDKNIPLFPILGTNADDTNCFPHVLSPPLKEALRKHLPFAVSEDNYWLKYSMLRDGSSMSCLLNKIRCSARTIIAIETMDGHVFGSFTSSPWRPNGRTYYGSGESFLWRLPQSRFTHCDTVEERIRLECNVDVYQWSRQNRNIQSLVNMNSQLMIGGGGPDDSRYDPYGNINYTAKEEDCQVGIILSNDLSRGTTDKCLTFKSPPLVSSPTGGGCGVFEIANIEVWTLTPVDLVDQAEKLEYGRQFIFDHGNFAES